MAQNKSSCGVPQEHTGGVTRSPEYEAANPLKGLLKDNGKGSLVTPSLMSEKLFLLALETHYICLNQIRQDCNSQTPNPYINLYVRVFRDHSRVARLEWRLKSGVGKLLYLPDRSTIDLFGESEKAIKVRKLLQSKTPGSFYQMTSWEYARESASLRSRQLYDAYHVWDDISEHFQQRWNPSIGLSVARQGKELCQQYNLDQLRLFPITSESTRS